MTDAAICIPVLASLDIAESQAFYQDQLGFAAERHGDYLLIRRNRMEIHFWKTLPAISAAARSWTCMPNSAPAACRACPPSRTSPGG